MLENYKMEQSNIYNLFQKAIKNDKIGHAYLIDTNNNSNSLNIVISIAKMLFCNKHYTSNNKCENCNICKRIDENNFLELKIIYPDGSYIKKEQVEDIQKAFSKEGIESEKRIYIINESEKMNASTANSILKFLEEPNSNIIAFLLTNNINRILPTIRSRCQILKLNREIMEYSSSIEAIAHRICNSEEDVKLFIENKKDFLEEIITYIKYYENNGLMTIVYNDKKLNLKNKKRDEINDIIDIMINFYYDVLLNKVNHKINIFFDESKFIDELSNKYEINRLLKIIEVLINYKELIKFNINSNLLFDDLIIRFEGVLE